MAKRQELPQPVAPIQLLTIPEVAERLRVKRTTVYGLIRNAGLPTVIVGSSMRVADQSLQKWIQEHERVS
jgi:excisionase family DNA binding protein